MGALNSATNWLSGVNPANAPLRNVNAPNFNQIDSYSGFGQIANNNPANPYFTQGNNFINQSAQAPDFQQFLNPYMDASMANMQKYVFNPQTRNAMGATTQAAGGNSAARSALVAQNLAKSQADALNQAGAGFYGQALAAGQQQRGMQQGAGALSFNAGTGALANALNARGAQQGSGNNLFGYEDMGNQAAYDQGLMRFQTPFQLASAYGQLAPAFGGTQTGTKEKIMPEESPFGKILGLAGTIGGAVMGGPMGASIGGSLGNFLGGGMGGGGAFMPNSNQGGWNPNVPGGFNFGGNFAEGGEVSPWAPGGWASDTFEEGQEAVDTGAWRDDPRAEKSAFPPRDIMLGHPFKQATPPTGPAPDVPPVWPPAKTAGTGAMSYAPEEEDATDGRGISIQPQPSSPFGGGLPMPPSFNGPAVQRAQNPNNPWMQAMFRMMRGAKRDQHGLLPGGSPFGQLMDSVSQGGEEYFKTADEQAKTEQTQAQAGFDNRMKLAPYQHMTAQQKAQDAREMARIQLSREQFNRKWNELTPSQKATIDYQLARLEFEKQKDERRYTDMTASESAADDLARQRLEKDRNAVTDLGTDPDTGFPVKGVRQPDGSFLRIDPNTGRLLGPDDKSASDGTIGGLSPDALTAAAERYLQSGTLPPNSGRGIQGSMERRAIQKRAAELAAEKGLDLASLPGRWQEFRAQQIAIQRFRSGPQSNTIRSLGVAVDHLDTARQLSEALKNKDLVAFNAIMQTIREQTGKPAPASFDAAKHIIGPEIIKAIGVAGAGTGEERKAAGEAFKRARSPAQIAGVINTYQRLLDGQLEGLKNHYITATGDDELVGFNKMLSPKVQEILKKSREGAGPKPKEETKKTELPVIKSKEEYDKLEPGTKFKGADGNEYEKPKE